jgi:large subunit ribosomal protein L4
MQVPVKNINGQVVEEIEVRDDVFAIEPNVPVMHQALVRQLANARQGTHSSKTRSEVSGTSAKWYRQKGTGRARHGNRKAPIFVGGGISHGPKPRSYTQQMPRKMRRLALRSALSAKMASAQVVILDNLQFEEPKTKNVLAMLKSLELNGSAVVLLSERNENVELSIRNLAEVKYLRAGLLNVRDLLGHDYVIMPKASLAVVESILGLGE